MFRRHESKSSSQIAPDFLIVGLGNPGVQYAKSRHNTGFMCVDLFADKQGFAIRDIKFKALTCPVSINGHRCLLVKPQTYMNKSGEVVSEIARFYKIPPAHIIVIYDDINLSPGKLRIRRGGSDGGHNGMKNIIYNLGNDNIPRIRIGVGEKPTQDFDLADWVLSDFTEEEFSLLETAFNKAIESAMLIVMGKIDEAMNKFNS